MILNVHRRIWAKILWGKEVKTITTRIWIGTTRCLHITIIKLHDYGKWHQNIIPYVFDCSGKQNTFKFHTFTNCTLVEGGLNYQNRI